MCGYALGKYLEKRSVEKGQFYQDLRKYVSQLKENIGGRNLEIDSYNSSFASNSSRIFADYLMAGKIKCRLSDTQKNNLNEFFGSLDCVSSEQLSAHIEYYEKVLLEDLRYVQEKEVARAAVYGKVGALIGAIIGILFM